MERISAQEKAARVVQPTVRADARQVTLSKAASRVATRSAVIGRFVARSRSDTARLRSK